MKKILVPTDFSTEAGYAAELAAKLAKRHDARVYLLHVLDIPRYESNSAFPTNQDIGEGLFLMEQVKQRFTALLSEPYWENVNVVEAIQFDNTYEGIAEHAADHEVDLVVMGSRGASGFKEWLVGSNTEKVIRFMQCPVLVVKDDQSRLEVNKVVLASNFYGELNDAWDALRPVFDAFDPEVLLLKVITPGGFEETGYSERLMNEFAHTAGLQNYSVNTYNARSVEEGIEAFIRREACDLLIFPTHQRKGLARLLQGSKSEGMANHLPWPVLTFPIPETEPSKGVLFPS